MASHQSSSCSCALGVTPATQVSGETAPISTLSSLLQPILDWRKRRCCNSGRAGKFLIQMTTKARRSSMQGEIHKHKRKRPDWLRHHTMDAHVSLPLPVEKSALSLSFLFRASSSAVCRTLHLRLPQRLQHCGSTHNLALTAPTVVRFSICLAVSQHPQSLCLAIIAPFPLTAL